MGYRDSIISSRVYTHKKMIGVIFGGIVWVLICLFAFHFIVLCHSPTLGSIIMLLTLVLLSGGMREMKELRQEDSVVADLIYTAYKRGEESLIYNNEFITPEIVIGLLIQEKCLVVHAKKLPPKKKSLSIVDTWHFTWYQNQQPFIHECE